MLHSGVLAASASSSGMSCDCLVHRLGNAADQPDRTRRYGSDRTDTEWAIVRPLLPVPAWMSLEASCSQSTRHHPYECGRTRDGVTKPNPGR